MPVYIDDARIPYGQMLMCHMVADSPEELRRMADRIGISRKHIQFPGTIKEHLNVCVTKQRSAIRSGAQLVSSRRIVEIINSRRGNGTPKTHGPSVVGAGGYDGRGRVGGRPHIPPRDDEGGRGPEGSGSSGPPGGQAGRKA